MEWETATTAPEHRDADVALMLDVGSLRASVACDDGVPALVLTDGRAEVQIGSGMAGPCVHDLIQIGRLVAATQRFQTACNRFTRARNRTATPLAKAAQSTHGVGSHDQRS